MSDVRRAVVWLMTLLAVVIAGDPLLAMTLHQLLVRSQFRYSRLYRGGNDADVLIFGDSRGVHSFYAPAIEELTGLRALNLSYNSLSPRVAEAVLLDYLEHNRPPRMVIIEPTSVITPGAVKTELRTYGAFSPRLTALYAEDHPVAARLGRLLWLYPLNSSFFLEALHYLTRSDQTWIHRESMPAALRVPQVQWRLAPVAGEVDALARMVALLQRRGIEVRLVFAPYAPVKMPANAAEFAAYIERRTHTPVWTYASAVDDLDAFADTVHLNEHGSRAFLRMLVRDGVFSGRG
jgi:hypothetical protein